MGYDQADQSGSIYSFGETNLAAERLRIVSEVFDSTSEAFLRETVRNRPRLAIDLGCGPGFTTRLLSRIARPERTVGLDRSEAFLSRARASAVAGEEYVAADVARMPFRIAGVRAQPDLIYARFLASHLPQPEQAISSWAKELEPGGLLLVEEIDNISTNVAAFDEYLRIVSQLLAQHGNELFVGARLATTRWDADLRTEINRATEVCPTTRQAARMFSMNLPNGAMTLLWRLLTLRRSWKGWSSS
jgi:trans-aconitate 2-methyltransferase